MMVKIGTFLVPGKEEEHGPGALVTLDENILGQPVFAIRMFGEELQKFCDKVGSMLETLPGAVASRDAAALRPCRPTARRWRPRRASSRATPWSC